MASSLSGGDGKKHWTLQSSFEAIDSYMKGIGAKFTNLLDFRQAPGDKEPKTLYATLAGSSLIPAIAARSTSATLQFGHRSGLGTVFSNLAYITPGGNDRTEIASRFPFLVATRGESARYLRYQPIWPTPLGTHYDLRLASPMSAEALQRSYSVYGTERIPPAGRAATALSRQEQTTAWSSASVALALHLSFPINYSGLWTLIWANVHNIMLANSDELDVYWRSAPAPVIGVVRRAGCLDTLTANAEAISNGRLICIETTAANAVFYGAAIRLLLASGIPLKPSVAFDGAVPGGAMIRHAVNVPRNVVNTGGIAPLQLRSSYSNPLHSIGLCCPRLAGGIPGDPALTAANAPIEGVDEPALRAKRAERSHSWRSQSAHQVLA